MSKASHDHFHKHYGPARRLSLMLMQLSTDCPRGFSGFEENYAAKFGIEWDDRLCEYLDANYSESNAQIEVIREATAVMLDMQKRS